MPQGLLVNLSGISRGPEGRLKGSSVAFQENLGVSGDFKTGQESERQYKGS